MSQWPDIGQVSALFITKDQKIWTGGTLRDLDGRIVGRLSSEVGDAGGAHEIAASDAGDVYVGQLSGVAQKFVRR